MPARTGPILDIIIGASHVDEISEIVETVLSIPTIVDVILGLGVAKRKVVI